MNITKTITLAYAFILAAASSYASLTTTAGYYDKRIASGAYDVDGAAFLNTSATLELPLPLMVGFEYVADDNYFVDGWIGTQIGNLSVAFIMTAFEVGNTDYEVAASYDFSFGPIADVSLGVSFTDAEPGGGVDKLVTIPSFTISKEIGLFDGKLGVLGGLQYGRSIGLDENYGFLLGFARLSVNLTEDLSVFGHGSYLKNDLTLNNDWDASYYGGVSYTF